MDSDERGLPEFCGPIAGSDEPEREQHERGDDGDERRRFHDALAGHQPELCEQRDGFGVSDDLDAVHGDFERDVEFGSGPFGVAVFRGGWWPERNPLGFDRDRHVELRGSAGAFHDGRFGIGRGGFDAEAPEVLRFLTRQS